jgi:putative membrane protein
MLWVKAAHVTAVIAWMAGLLYLPRLFVYHADAERGSQQSETFKIMERRLYRGIMTPAMIATWVFGLWLALGWGFFGTGAWLHAKLVLVIALTGYQGLCGRWLKGFAADTNKRGARFYRMVNEVPALVLIAIVVLVVVKPF